MIKLVKTIEDVCAWTLGFTLAVLRQPFVYLGVASYIVLKLKEWNI